MRAVSDSLSVSEVWVRREGTLVEKEKYTMKSRHPMGWIKLDPVEKAAGLAPNAGN